MKKSVFGLQNLLWDIDHQIESMHPPFIGITTGFQSDDPPRQSLNHRYVLAVARAGGCPVLLPMVEHSGILAPLLSRLDGLIITGGPGITDGLIGDLPSDLPCVSALRHQNDLFAFNSAQHKQNPVFGICYGMQFINARYGGTIFADVQHQCHTVAHSPKRTGGIPVSHRILVEPLTHLAKILGDSHCETNSLHIQAVRSVGTGLRVSARSDDGVIEGIESRDGRIIGVQFHPEEMPGTVFDRLFDFFIKQAIEKKTQGGTDLREGGAAVSYKD